jgi:minichromosome maintenance protein 10
MLRQLIGRKRSMAHSAVQDFLYGRYYLTPTLLYSVIRLSRDGATYDLPVDGDWLTIAVVAERGEVKISGTKNTSKNDDDSDDGEEPAEGIPPPRDPKKFDFKKKGKPEYKKRPPRKYVNLKLCSLPPRSRSGSSASGDALLQLLLFESDSVATEIVENEDGEKVTTKRYLGGSGGAYERWCNLTVGSVIAIMNPKVLRPLRVSSLALHRYFKHS